MPAAVRSSWSVNQLYDTSDIDQKYGLSRTLRDGYGIPKTVHLASIIGAREGVEFVASQFSDDTHLWIADIDEGLDERGYIVPGLGDAGDLAFGEKLQK